MENNSASRILIVEDDIDIQTLLDELLVSSGYIVDCANNGQEALTKLQMVAKATDLTMPDLIILDLMMPVMNGYQFCEEVEKSEVFSRIPIILMSAAKKNSEVLPKVFEGKGFLEKPFSSIDTVLKIINLYIRAAGGAV